MAKPEHVLKKVLEQMGMAMVKDERGSGKSSMVNHVLSDLGPEFFPILFRLTLSGDFEGVCSKPSKFAEFILARTTQSVKDCTATSEQDKETYRKYLADEISYKEGKKLSVLGRIKSKFTWIPWIASAEAEIGADLQKYTETALGEGLYNTERIECIQGLCETISANGKNPIFVFDDTDNFLQQGAIDRRNLVDRFFVDIMPMFKEFGCGVIMNSHASYETYSTFQSAQKNLSDEVVSIPVLDFEGFVGMMEKKMQSIMEDVCVLDSFDEEALNLVYDHPYRRKADERMRDTMLALQGAVRDADDAGVEKATVDIMARSILESGY